jgi:hypothetical protein
MQGGEGETHINFTLESHEEEATANVKMGLTEMLGRLGSHLPDYLLYLFLDYLKMPSVANTIYVER